MRGVANAEFAVPERRGVASHISDTQDGGVLL